MSIRFVYVTELLSDDYTNVISAFNSTIDGTVTIWITIWFQFIDKHWKPIALIGVVQSVVSFALILVLLPESPKWLLNTGKVQKVKGILRKWTKGHGDQMRVKELIDGFDNKEEMTIDSQNQLVKKEIEINKSNLT